MITIIYTESGRGLTSQREKKFEDREASSLWFTENYEWLKYDSFQIIEEKNKKLKILNPKKLLK